MQTRRWFIVSLCFLAVAINDIDRANLGVAVPLIRKESGLDPAVMGLILSGLSWTYALMQLPGGWLIDRFGTWIIFTVVPVLLGVSYAGLAFAGADIWTLAGDVAANRSRVTDPRRETVP